MLPGMTSILPPYCGLRQLGLHTVTDLQLTSEIAATAHLIWEHTGCADKPLLDYICSYSGGDGNCSKFGQLGFVDGSKTTRSHFGSNPGLPLQHPGRLWL